MPCSDGGPDPSQEMQERNDELAQQVCKMGKVLCELFEKFSVDIKSEDRYLEAFVFYKKHRSRDKKNARERITDLIRGLEKRIQYIEKLGGSGGQNEEQIIKLKEKLEEVNKSDPLNTDLY